MRQALLTMLFLLPGLPAAAHTDAALPGHHLADQLLVVLLAMLAGGYCAVRCLKRASETLRR